MNDQTQFTPFPVPDGIVQVHGKSYMADGTGKLTAIESIPPLKKLRDEMVRREFGFALALADQIARFRGHVMTNLGQFDALMMQEFGVTIGGLKGNRSYTTHDGLMKIQVAMQDRIAFGPEMQVAKIAFDTCLREWSNDTRAELRSIVTAAFDTDREGTINRSNVSALLNTESDDPRWQQGQEAIRAAMYSIGAKEYLRFLFRPTQKDAWVTVSIDLART